MLITLGYSSMIFSFFAAVYGIAALLIGTFTHSSLWIRSGRQSCLILFPLLSISVGSLITLLIRNDYQVDYVYQTVSNFQPSYLKIAALWGKQSGSLLFWSWLFSLFLFIWALQNSPEKDPLFSTAAIFLLANLAFSTILHIWIDNPFARYWQTDMMGNAVLSIFPVANSIPLIPDNGLGMNPLLRHYGMVFHPPALYLGFIGVFFPAAYEISALIHTPSDSSWMKKVRSWAIFAWIFLAIGLILGSRWAYDVLGWGGYWGWDPVEVAALIPFLLLTAYLHAAIGYSNTGGFRSWSTVLGLFVFVSVIFATFVTRSGLISSVHAFSVSPLSSYLSVYLVSAIILTVFLLVFRGRFFRNKSSKIEMRFIDTLQTRESFFTAEILIFCIISFFCLWGILLPNLSEILTGTKISIGADYYVHSTGPLFALMLIVMGTVPLTRWKKSPGLTQWIVFIVLGLSANIVTTIYCSSRDIHGILLTFILWVLVFSILIIVYDWISNAIAYHKNTGQNLFASFFGFSRHFFGSLIHAGIILMAFGIIGIEFLQVEEQIQLAPNESQTAAGFTFKLDGIEKIQTDEGETLSASIRINKGDTFVGTVKPQRKYYAAYNQETTIPGIYSTLSGDLYLILTSSESPDLKSERIFTVFYNPWINWLWIGGIILCLGGILLFIGSTKMKKVKNHAA